MLRNKKYNSFLGKHLYDHVVPENHFLRKVNELINWHEIVDKLVACYKGEFQMGTSPINPLTIFKMMFLSFVYDQSERYTEIVCNENIVFKYFIEIAVDEDAPDHSTISKFRKRMIEHYKDEKVFEDIFVTILIQISNHPEIEFGEIQIIDSKHMNARVSRYRKTKHYKGENEKQKQKKLKQEIDPDASSGNKGYEKRKDKQGKIVEIPKWFFGYKAHTSIENKNDLITSCILSTGKEADGDYFEPLFWKDAARRGLADIYGGDKGYDWGDNHYLLNQMDVGDAIILNDYRLKDDSLHAVWQKIYNSEEYKKGKKERFKVERTFGDMFNNLGIHNCRFFGKIKTAIQMFMTALVYNIKKAVKTIWNISPKIPATC